MQNLYLAHHGILGQKWGVRRFQNPDGTLTFAGKRRQKEIETKKYLLIENINANNNYIHKLTSDMKSIRENGVNSEVVKERMRKTIERNPKYEDLIDANVFADTTYKELKAQRDWQIQRGSSYVNAVLRLSNLDPNKVSKSDIRKAAKVY